MSFESKIKRQPKKKESKFETRENIKAIEQACTQEETNKMENPICRCVVTMDRRPARTKFSNIAFAQLKPLYSKKQTFKSNRIEICN